MVDSRATAKPCLYSCTIRPFIDGATSTNRKKYICDKQAVCCSILRKQQEAKLLVKRQEVKECYWKKLQTNKLFYALESNINGYIILLLYQPSEEQSCCNIKSILMKQKLKGWISCKQFDLAGKLLTQIKIYLIPLFQILRHVTK